MMESSQGVLRLCHPCFNHIEYCTLSELRGVLEHPVHPPGYATDMAAFARK